MELNRKSNLVVAAVQEAALRRQITATEEILKIESAELDLVRQGFSVGVVSQTDVLSKEALLDQAARDFAAAAAEPIGAREPCKPSDTLNCAKPPLRNSRDVGPRFHGMSVQHFTRCRPGISRHVGPGFHGMSVQFVR